LGDGGTLPDGHRRLGDGGLEGATLERLLVGRVPLLPQLVPLLGVVVQPLVNSVHSRR